MWHGQLMHHELKWVKEGYIYQSMDFRGFYVSGFVYLKDMAVAVLVLIVSSFVLSSYGMDGGRRSLSRDEDLELDKLLRILNKPAIKTIQTRYGDLFDCVDINKQPAFDNPLLKNHTLQLRPTSLPKMTVNESASSAGTVVNIGLEDGGCLPGTVPIRRTQKEELIRAKYHFQFGKKIHTIGQLLSSEYPGYHYVALCTYEGKFYGAKALMNVWGLQFASDQFSLTELWVQNGPQDQVNSIQAGWAVGHGFYSDDHTRLFGYWTAGGQTGCFDLFCPGFVQVSPDVPLGQILDPLSTYNGDQYVLPLLVFKDPKTENWWLIVGDENIGVGYWPKSLFNSLSNYSISIAWGGETYNPQNSSNPPMGSGHFPEEGYGKSCYQSQLHYVDGNNALWAPSNDMLYTSLDQPKCYNGMHKSSKGEWGQYFIFGGPGGNCGN